MLLKNLTVVLESGFNRQVRNLKVSMLDKSENPLSLAVLEGNAPAFNRPIPR